MVIQLTNHISNIVTQIKFFSHQYCSYLSSKVGKAKLSRILKAWVIYNEDKEVVYWQGIDSLAACFLVLNFHYESRAFGSLICLIEKYLKNLFANDNSSAMEYILLTYEKLLMYHDPEIALHMKEIGYFPELYAIPW